MMLSGRLAATAIDLAMVVFFGLLMFMYDWALTLVGIAMVVANLAFMRFVSEQRVDGNRRLLQEEGKFRGSLMSGLGTLRSSAEPRRSANDCPERTHLWEF